MQDINEIINELIENAVVVTLLFGDESCAPCHALKQKIDRWHEDFPEVETRYVPIADNMELCGQLGVFSVPSLSCYIEGKNVAFESGYFSLEVFLGKVERYLELYRQIN